MLVETDSVVASTKMEKWCVWHPHMREANRQREVAPYLVAEFQRKKNARRAKEHNEALSRVGKGAAPIGVESPVESTTAEEPSAESEPPEDPSAESPAESTRFLFKEGAQKIEEFAYELELPDKSGYRFYPAVHVSRLKAVDELGERPTTRLRPELGEAGRIDFDEELLPEDSWEPDENEDKYEVEAILDDELPLSTSTVRAQRTFKVKWVGHDERSWEPLSNWSYGGLLFDYLRNKKRENRLKMAQVADEN
ncbi:unnamed protein product [Phytophthora fragariaefolia]|uniref:Unnamed protein product n=1 Tax=Phytophthora fragariaefolia TaxID=1490495 RepID=A0A9W7D409_9STRA|nr:unnamed protein product [Phytophthora fragariaefolia]